MTGHQAPSRLTPGILRLLAQFIGPPARARSQRPPGRFECRRLSWGTGNGPCFHPRRTRALEAPGERIHSRTRSDYVVHDHDVAVDCRPGLEGVRDIGAPRRRIREGRLGRFEATAPAHDSTNPNATDAPETACDFQCLIESAFTQPCRADRNRYEPVRRGLTADRARKQSGEYRHHAQIEVELEPSDEIVDRRSIRDRAHGAIDGWTP